MKLIFSIATLSCFVAQTFGQVTAGSGIIKSPAVTSGTNQFFSHGKDPFLENPGDMELVQYSERPFLGNWGLSEWESRLRPIGFSGFGR